VGVQQVGQVSCQMPKQAVGTRGVERRGFSTKNDPVSVCPT
jgi:hypothetical protein